ncbi:Stc1 domain-containing protein [Aspergillus coremiiformis]|uniref:Stc1 domain-containing protein n=1 Tax=Aspergillus coremiiformis TaxID=138285 RepID=A0A5N6ZCD9_9EURO|nr:Stc1 domain-containing protein [Aspergillus coremiiformis]
MGDRVRNAYSGGYSDAIKRQVKCITCKKMRMHSTYSKRQLDVLRNAMVVQGDRALMGPGHAKCRECVGGQTVELRCIICDKTKSLEEFAKAQRHDRDLARCLTCVQNHTETDPVIEEQKLLTESEMSTVQETTATSVDDGYSYSTSVYGEGDSDDVDDDDDYSVGGGVWVEAEHPQESSRSKSNEREYTGYDQHGMPHRLVSSRPVVPEGVHTGWASWGITANSAKAHGPRASPFESSRSNKPSSVQKKPSNFAKIPKMRPERSSPPAMRTPEPSGHNIPYEGDGGNDSVEDYL